jgi:cytochrome P450
MFDTSIFGCDAREVWKAMRAEGPLLHPNPGAVVAVSTTAVKEALHDPAVFSSHPSAGYFGSETGAIPLQVDPPLHSRYRKLLDPMFSPRLMAEREDDIAQWANDLIDAFVGGGSVDFSKQFAVPFPSIVFLRMMGLPTDELDEFLAFKEQMIRPEGADEEARKLVQNQAAGWIFGYVSEALALREHELTDDILSQFVRLERDGKLTRDETLNICLLFLPAGLDTVTDTLECSMVFLAGSPDHQRQLAEHPELAGRAAEELLRFETPVPTVSRIAMSDATLDGCPVAKGTRVRVMLSQVNHDPEIYPDADTVDFERETNPHIAFGGGVHRCVGSNLARVELRVALREWHRRIPSYRLQEGFVPKYRQSLREIEHLPIEFDAAVPG